MLVALAELVVATVQGILTPVFAVSSDSDDDASALDDALSGEYLSAVTSIGGGVGGDNDDGLTTKAPLTSRFEAFGWVMFQWSWVVFYLTVQNAFLPVYMSTLATNLEDEQHAFQIFPGIRVAGSNYYPTVVPVAIVFQILAIILFGTVGDFGFWRKYLLVGCSVFGSVSTALLVIVQEDSYFLAIVFLVISTTTLIIASIMYNAYLPLLVANFPEVRARVGKPDYNAVEIRAANRLSTTGIAVGFIGGIIMLGINIGIGAAFPPSCKTWCKDCPSALGNATVPGWAAYEYEIENETMVLEQKYCTTSACLAWPGINPPCGRGEAGDIVEGKCVRRGLWEMYEYTASGARWNATLAVPADEAAARAAQRSDLCTTPPTARPGNLSAVDGPGPLALASGNGNSGCPHFRCARLDCEFGHDPTTCDPEHWGFRLTLMSAGVWWGLFAAITYVALKPRPSPPLPPGVSYVRASLQRMRKTFKKVRRLRHAFLFLVAYWLASDGANTVAYGAVIIASKSPLFFGATDVGLLLLLINLVGALGVVFYERLALWITTWWRRRQVQRGADEKELDSYWVCKFVIYCNLLCAFMLPVWGLPITKGLQSRVEFYVAAGIYGFQLGSLGAFSRVLLQHLTPHGCESEFFAFMELSGKITSWVGPLFFVAISTWTQDERWALGSVSVLFVLAMIALGFIDAKQGHKDASNFHVAEAERENSEREEAERNSLH